MTRYRGVWVAVAFLLAATLVACRLQHVDRKRRSDSFFPTAVSPAFALAISDPKAPLRAETDVKIVEIIDLQEQALDAKNEELRRKDAVIAALTQRIQRLTKEK